MKLRFVGLAVLLAVVLALGSCSSRSEKTGVEFNGHGQADHAKLADIIAERCG